MRPIASWGSPAIAVALAVQLAASGCGAPAPGPPNLLLITADGLRADALVCYRAAAELGSDACSLGERGVQYAWALAAAPSGAPSAASLLTSAYPSQHGVGDDPATFLPYLGPPTLAEVLRDGGYATAAIVESPELNRSRALDRGFDRYERPSASEEGGESRSLLEQVRGFTTRAREPWFVWVHLADAHGPFDTHDRRRFRSEYDAAVRRLDRKLSRLVGWLDGDAVDAGVLLTALHGQSLGERPDRLLGHGTALDLAQLHVPLLWRPPRTASAGSGRVEVVVGLIDVAPTLVAAAGLAAPASFEGRPLPASDAEAQAAIPRGIFAELPDAVAVARHDLLAVFPRTLVREAGEGDRASASARRGERTVLLRTVADADRAAPARADAADDLRVWLGALPVEWGDRATEPRP